MLSLSPWGFHQALVGREASNTAVRRSNLLSIKQKHDWHRTHLNHSQYVMTHQECIGNLSHYISLTKKQCKPSNLWMDARHMYSILASISTKIYLLFAAFTFTCCKKQQHSVYQTGLGWHMSLYKWESVFSNEVKISINKYIYIHI